MKTFASLGVMFLCGCAAIPGTESTVENTQSTTPIIFRSQKNVANVAECVIRNIDKNLGSMTPSLQTDARPKLMQVRVRSAAGVAGLVDVEADASGGSIVAVRISNHYLAKQTLAKLFTKDC